MIKLFHKTTKYCFSISSTWANAELHKPNFGDIHTYPWYRYRSLNHKYFFDDKGSVRDVFIAANVPLKFEIINEFTF